MPAPLSPLEKLATLKRRAAALTEARSTWDPHWKELLEQFAPRSGRWFLTDTNKGTKEHSEIINSTPLDALRTFRSGMMAGLTSRVRPWFRLTTTDARLAGDDDVRRWLWYHEDLLRAIFHGSNIYNGFGILYATLGAIGTACVVLDEDDNDVLRATVLPTGSYYLGIDSRGRPNQMYRMFRFSLEQLAEHFGYDALPSAMQKAFDNREFKNEHTVHHLIAPNPDAREPFLGTAGRWLSTHWLDSEEPTKRGVLREAGYRVFPVIAPRWEAEEGETYGSSLGMDALGDSRQLQVMERRKLQAIDKYVDPPLRGPASLRHEPIDLLPRGVTLYDSRDANQKLEPIYEQQMPLEYLERAIERVEGRINLTMLVPFFRSLIGEPVGDATAREIDERHDEKVTMLAPNLERLNTELLDPIIARAWDIIAARGWVLPAPPAMDGHALTVEYISPLALAYKRLGLGDMDRWSAALTNLATTFGEDALDELDAGAFARAYHEALNLPPAILRPPDEVAARRQQRAAQARAAALAQAAQPIATAAEKLGKTSIEQPSALQSLLSGYQDMAAGDA